MSRKRVIISLILTIVVIVSTISYWIIYRPLTFSMDIRSLDSNTIIVTTVLNRKDEPSFSKSYEDGSQINLKANEKYNVSFEHKTPPKRLRFILVDVTPDTEYRISNMSFRDGKYPVDDLTKFNSDDAELRVEDNSLIIIPYSSSATVDYSDRIKAKPAVKFDLKIFLIITILSYLLIYKLTSYLADFKLNKDVSRLDIVFLTICTLLLFLPMTNVNHDDVSIKENRTPAKYKPLINSDKSINLNFGKDYENWISDRFGFRDFLINRFKDFKINMAMTSRYYMTKKAYWDKKTNWMFNYPLLHNTLSDKDINDVSLALNNFNTFCKKNNVKLYLLIVPQKGEIYIQNTYLEKDYSNSYESSIKKFRQNTGIPIVYPFNELREGSKKDYVFFKTDHHWTDWGAYIGYKALMKEVKKDFPDIKYVLIEDFNITQSKQIRSDWSRNFHAGHTFHRILHLPNIYSNTILDSEYCYFTHKNHELLKTYVINISKLMQKTFEYPEGANLKALMIGTSMNENLTEILPYIFKETRYLRVNNIKDIHDEDTFKIIKIYGQNITDFKPDIMVLCITADNLPRLKDLTNED